MMADTFERGRANQAMAEIALALQRHSKAIAMLSGGKDSVVMCDLLEPFSKEVTLVWVSTGAELPHMAPFIRNYARRFRFQEIISDQRKRFARVGLPSRIVPIFNTPLGLGAEYEPHDRVMLTDWVSCCTDLRFRPALEWVKQTGVTLMFHGQRSDDNTKPFPVCENMEVCAPIWPWSTSQVMDYVAAHSLPLPEQYPEVMDSFDCANCPASATRARMDYLAKRYPDIHAETQSTVKQIYDAVFDELRKN